MSEQPALPYGGATNPISGFTGSSASAARARDEDRKGITGKRQRQVVAAVSMSGTWGMTWREVAYDLDLHHGQASAALSNMHKVGQLVRLAATRNRCSVYVTPANVDGRLIEEPGRNSTTEMLAQMAALLERCPRCGHGPLAETGCLSCDTTDVLRRYEARQK